MTNFPNFKKAYDRDDSQVTTTSNGTGKAISKTKEQLAKSFASKYEIPFPLSADEYSTNNLLVKEISSHFIAGWDARQEEIDELKSKLYVAEDVVSILKSKYEKSVECLKFFANEHNWSYSPDGEYLGMTNGIDKAQETLKELVE